MQPRTSEINLKECYFDSNGRCGYCWNPSGLITTGFRFNKVSTENYNDLLNYGFCRYGLSFYVIDPKKSCCKLFGHRLDVTKFVPRTSQKKAIKKWEKFLANPEKGIIKKKDVKKGSHDQDSLGFEELKVSTEDEDEIQELEVNEKMAVLEKSPEEQKKFEEKTLLLESVEKLLSLLNEANGKVSQELGLPESENLIMGEKGKQSLKLLNPNSKKHGDYNSNVLFMLYLENKNALATVNIKDIAGFVKKIEEPVLELLNTCCSDNFKVQIQQNGYITFDRRKEGMKNLDENQDKVPLLHKKLDKKEEKTLPKKAKAQEKAPKKSSKKKSSDDLLDSELEEKCQKLQIKFVKAEFDPEAHALYYKHCTLRFPKKTESSKGESVFRTFFCTPAIEEQTLISQIPSPENEPPKTLNIGHFHMKYYYEGKLIALGVLDIVPTGMQSIYFLFDPDYDHLSLGTIGVIKEIDYMKKMQKYFPDFKYYYLGGYIQTCPKIKYKVDYDPAELLCPITQTWVKFDEKIKQKIDNGEVRLAEDDVKIPEDLDFSEVDLDQYIMWSVKINSQKFFEVNMNTTAKILNPLRKSVALLGKKMIADINFDYFDYDEYLYEDF